MKAALLRAVQERRREADVVSSEDVAALPRKGYGEKRYWVERYESTRDDETFDWLCSWQTVREAVRLGPRVLHVGCGNSAMGVEMAREGVEVVNSDYSENVIEAMRRRYPRENWAVADATALPFADESFDAVVDKGTLDALACADDKTLAAKMVRECLRVASRSFSCASFGQPETRLRYFPAHVTHTKLTPVSRTTKNASPVYVYTVLKKTTVVANDEEDPSSSRWRRRRRLGSRRLLLLAVCVATAGTTLRHLETTRRQRKMLLVDDEETCARLEPTPGTARCNYELLRAFSEVAKGLQWTLGAGTLLGAARSTPPGLLPWERDVDVYVEAPDAFALLDRLPEHDVLHFRGHVDRDGRPCCGFGFKLFHATRSECELDVLVLSRATHAPWVHGGGATPTFLATGLAFLSDAFSVPPEEAGFLVIPEDARRLTLCADSRRWHANHTWAGPSLSYFHREYFRRGEFHPIRTIAFYDLTVNVPADPWASLWRTYGPDCHTTARLDVHGGLTVDLRRPAYAHLLRPAHLDLGPSEWATTTTTRETIDDGDNRLALL